MFYEKYITSDYRKKYIDDDGIHIYPNKCLESFTMKNIRRHFLINIMVLKVNIYKIQEYVGHIKEEKEGKQVLCIL